MKMNLNIKNPFVHNKILGNILGDRYSKNMVKFNYFEAKKAGGDKVYHYVGSKRAVKRLGEERGEEYEEVREVPFDEVERMLGPKKMEEIRLKTKGMYTSSGRKIYDEKG